MDFPEPPHWLVVIGSIIIAPLWAMFLFLWLLHMLVSELIRKYKGDLDG